MKKIVYCADGTWDGKSSATNVFKLFNALVISSQQMPFYDSGVGADGSPLEKFVQGAFGAGLFQKIKDGYTKISQVYEAGDELFLFGFSRGAYTARSLAGMIATCGLPSKNFDDQLVENAFNAYRNRDERAAILATLSSKYSMCTAQITMVGVWDTVGALGVPAIFGQVDPVIYGFLDTSLNPVIKNAFQALAIDERRREFPPTLWTSQTAPGQTVQQVWFCGVHSDVGGGYQIGADAAVTALSDITLSWMMNKAQNLGVEFASTALVQCKYPVDPSYALDQLHDSWSAIWGFPVHRTIPPGSCLANSVLIRCQHHDGYSPCNLSLQNGIPASTYPLLAVLADPPAVNLVASPTVNPAAGPPANPPGCAPSQTAVASAPATQT